MTEDILDDFRKRLKHVAYCINMLKLAGYDMNDMCYKTLIEENDALTKKLANAREVREIM